KNLTTTNIPKIVDLERGYNPPLGLLYLASYIRKYTDYEIEVLDAIVEELNYSGIERRIEEIKPDVVGIQAMSFTLIDALLCAKVVKRIDGDIPVIFGGPHPTIFPQETINLKEVDYVVVGEGEVIFKELIENVNNPQKLRETRGLVYKEKGRIIDTGTRNFIEDLDSIPFPSRELTPYKKYYSLIAKRSPITTMITSRGCPYRCLFCDRPQLGKRFRARSAENVVDEMEECLKMGIKEILIYDDTFTVNRQRVLDICSEILKRRLKIIWDIRARVDNVDREMLQRLKEAGCERIHYGVEASNQRILDILRKEITLEQVKKAFRLTKEAGISTLAYFMFGSPGETEEEIRNSIKLAKELKPDFAHFSITTPFPSTDLYRLGLKEKILKGDYWKKFSQNPEKDFIPQVWEENLSQEELMTLLKSAYRSFYVRPSYILKELTKVKSLKEFRRKIKAGLGVVKL
nr:radical SAM protein [Bacillota bacterium]